jgi:hypothetical protein
MRYAGVPGSSLRSVSLGLLLGILAALTVWSLASVAAAVDAGRRWGWRWGLGLWLIWPVALFPWAIRRRREGAADRIAGIKRPVGV